ncbi:MAG: 4Fe-4S cluster-binding domain-containing protein [Anaeroplasma sp.]|uniref:4Fe-4S cluster-binding domain-containing protein n=1 Tax=Anaeroplasma sp. TaxID=1872523 RepID=UPI002A90F219|nr:4Fe-4S cluster-binding domain-containing protein [Anaeroplasma sp.]MDY5982750.1 4Fe-4S cluster-binding domain-containing protein [Anaeroplasma sp.]
MKIVINTIRYDNSLVDGPGIRTDLFLQGCDIHCPGCQNESTWDIRNGIEIEIDDLVQELKSNMKNNKLTITGGEPLYQKEALIVLINKLEGFDIALYTGHQESDVPEEIKSKIKYLKCGPFIERLKTTVKPYVGSSNQEFKEVK